MKIVYAGIVLSDTVPVPDGNGATWLVTAMSGWESMPARLNAIDYSMRHGGVPSNPTYGPKSLGLTGICKAPSESVFWLSYNALIAANATLTATQDLTVTEDVDKTVSVVRGSEPRFRIRPGHFEFELSLTAYDPLKYGAAITTALAAGATAALTSAGNIDSPRLAATLTGSGTFGLTNVGTGPRVYSRVGMTSGTVIDFRSRTAYLGDQNQYHQLSPSSVWWPLVPGANSVQNNGSAPLSITYRPAWA